MMLSLMTIFPSVFVYGLICLLLETWLAKPLLFPQRFRDNLVMAYCSFFVSVVKGQQARSTFFLAVVHQVFLNMTTYNKVAAACRTTNSLPRRALVGHVIKAVDEKRLETCVSACDFELNCFSINYFLTSRRCELNRKTAEWHLADLVPMDDSVYLTIIARQYNPCVDVQLPCWGTCIPIPGSLAVRCSCEGNQTCGNNSCMPRPLGMEAGLIRRDQITVSSTHRSSEKNWGRLNNLRGSWTPNTDYKYQWFQVNFDPYLKLITHIATQGNGINVWYVRKYYVMYKAGDSPLQEYHEDGKRKIFHGNSDQDAIIKNKIANPLKADAIRIVPSAFSGRIALRIELYGCNL